MCVLGNFMSTRECAEAVGSLRHSLLPLVRQTRASMHSEQLDSNLKKL